MKSFRSRIITAVLTASFLSIAITVFYGVRTIDQSQRLAVRDRLVSDAAMAADYYAKTGGAAKDLYTLLSGRMHLKGVRLTVMDPSGTIVFDSAKPKDGSFDNHKDRPEVIEAMKSGSGYSTRDSASLGLELAYATSAIEGGGVLRLAVPMENVHRAIHDRTELLIQVGIWAALISLVIAFLVSQALRRSFSPMIDIVEAIAAGRFNRRIRKYPGKEFEPLARAVNSMAEGIEEQVHAYADQTAQLEAVLNTMEDGVLVLGPRGHIRRCNLALERAFPGVGDARGRQCVEVIPHPALQKTVDEILSSPSDGTARTVSLHLGLTSGQVFSVLLSRPAQPDPRFGLVAVFRDVTELMRLEQVRRDFVANVSHELRTPLTAISGYAETIIGVGDVEQCHRFAEVILRNADGLTNMVRDLLSLTRLENKTTVVSIGSTSARQAFDEAYSVCRKAFEDRKVEVKCTIGADCAVKANSAYLTQVFRNLLENASRFADEGSVVNASCRLSNGQVVFRISDKGPVIPAKDIERIFERFYSVDRNHAQGATGLGLAICRHILDRLHGRIWAESPDRDNLTSFLFTLPPADSAPVEAGAEPSGAGQNGDAARS